MNRPRPVLTSSGIAGLITSVAGVLAWLGYSDASTGLSAMTTTITAVAIGAVTLGSHLLAALHAQGKVTPNSDPQDHDGMPLVRADTAAVAAPVTAVADASADPVAETLAAPAPPAA